MSTQVAEAFASDLCRFIAEEVALVDEPVTNDADLLLTGLVDSLGVVMISTWIQDQIGIVIDPVDVVLENFQTVDLIVAYLKSRSALS